MAERKLDEFFESRSSSMAEEKALESVQPDGEIKDEVQPDEEEIDDADVDSEGDPEDADNVDSEEEPDEETEESDEEDPPPKKKGKSEDWEARFKDTEEKRKEFQRRSSKAELKIAGLEQQLATVMEAVQNLSTQKRDGEVTDLMESFSDSDLITGSDLKKIVGNLSKKQQTQVVKPPPKSGPDPNFVEWIALQKDQDKIETYLEDRREEIDARLKSIDTNEYGKYFVIRSMAQEEDNKTLKAQLKKQEKLIKKLKQNSSRPKTPISGPGGRNMGSGGRSPATGGLERYFRS